jgi:uncharacterized protein (TIGR03382 family)
MPQEWRDEGADGVLSGHLWVSSPSNTPNNFSLSTLSVYTVPEPSLALFALALLGLQRRRRMT